MIIENIELTMSQLGLGQLDEYALMVMFGNAHSHHLVDGLEHTPEDIRDQAGLLLYPAYFLTHLKVPPHTLLNRFRAWHKVDVGCHVTRFGDTVLDSQYVLARDGQAPQDISEWSDDYITMTGNNLIVVDATEEGAARKVSVPAPGLMANLEKMRRPPMAIMKARKRRGEGYEPTGPGKLATVDPIIYELAPFRDAAPGHAMIFAMFTRLMDFGEFQLLSRLTKPSLPHGVLHHMQVLEREIYYYGNCFCGDEVNISLSGDMELTDPGFHGEALDIISAARFTFNIQVKNNRNGALLALARVEKLLALPTSLQDLTQDVKRFYKHYYS